MSRKTLDSSKLKEFSDNNFKFDKMAESSPKRPKCFLGKGEIARYEQFLLFLVFSKDLYCRHVKTRACLGNGLRYLDPKDRIFNRVISDISVVLRETTLTISDSIETL